MPCVVRADFDTHTLTEPCCVPSLFFAGYLFDGEYHYYHHAFLTVNYAELEILDQLMGTHHSQQARFVQKGAAR